MVNFNDGFWAGKRVLITGHTGFKGSWLVQWLAKRGASIIGLSLPPEDDPCLFNLAHLSEISESHFSDIRNFAAVYELVRSVRPEIVIHLAAQALVREGYRSPIQTFETNVLGTANVLESIRSSETVRVVLIVTTDKVYFNNDSNIYPFRENDPLGGHDPYSASKAASEIVVASYRDAFYKARGIAVSSARAGNVIGGGDWARNRLIPDAVRRWQQGQVLDVRRPHAVRPWQHVLEPLHGYMTLCEAMWYDLDIAGAYNFGPVTSDFKSVKEIIEIAKSVIGPKAEISYSLEQSGPHEAHWLSLETVKAAAVLGVRPRWSTAQAVKRTMAWYKYQSEGVSAKELCLGDIIDYETSLASDF